MNNKKKKIWTILGITISWLAVGGTGATIAAIKLLNDGNKVVIPDVAFNPNFNGLKLDFPNDKVSEKATEEFIKQQVFYYRNKFFINAGYKNQTFFRDNIAISDIVYNDSLGKVTFTCTLNNYNDKNESIKKENLYFSGFKAFYAVSFNQTSEYPFGDPTILAEDSTINETWIKNKVIEHKEEIFIIPETIPVSYNWKNNLQISGLKASNIDGKVSFQCVLNNATNNYPTNPNIINQTISFTNFYKPYSITFKATTEFALGDPNLLASDASIDGACVEELIVNNKDEIFNISDIPYNYDWYRNLVVKNIKRDSKNHKIIFDVTLINANNNPTGSNTIVGSLTFTNFKTPYLITFKDNVNEFDYGDTNLLASDASINEAWIKDKIIQHIDAIFDASNNAPSNFNWSNNLTISQIIKDPTNSKITFNVSLSNASDDFSFASINKTLVFTGFKIPYYISFKDQVEFAYGDSTKLAIDSTIDIAWIKKQIVDHKEEIFNIPTNIPNDFNWNDNLQITSITTNNEVGKLYFEVSLTNATDDISKSNLIIKNIVFSGFKLSWYIKFKQTSEFALGDPNLLASDASINDAWIKQKILDNIDQFFIFPQNGPSSYDWDANITISPHIIKDPTNKKITFNVSLNKWTDDTNKQRVIEKDITFINFKAPYYISFNDQAEFAYGDDTKLVDDSSINEDWIKNQIISHKDEIFKIPTNIPNDFKWNDNLTISSIIKDVNNYKLSFVVTLNNWTNDISKTQQITKTIIFTNFASPYSITFNSQNKYALGDPNKLALGGSANAEWIKERVIAHKNEIFNIPSNIPRDFNWNDNLSISIISGDNSIGELTFKVTLNNSRNDIYESISKEIVFYGFKIANYNIEFKHSQNHEYYISDPNIVASVLSVDRDWIKKKVIEYKEQIFNISGEVPSDFNWYNNLRITNISCSPLDGCVNTSIELHNSSSNSRKVISNDIIITGFKKR